MLLAILCVVSAIKTCGTEDSLTATIEAYKILRLDGFC